MNKTKGFTIIELIVVIAIIAVLAAIVMVNVTQYLNKGKDAAIQGKLSGILTDAAQIYDDTGSYATVCTNATVAAALAAADAAYDGNTTANQVTDCNASGTSSFAACGQLKGSDAYFCVDSNGTKKTTTTRATCVTGWTGVVCP